MSVLKKTDYSAFPQAILLRLCSFSSAFAVLCDTLPKQWLVAFLLLLGSVQAVADRFMPSEYEVKAAFIYNIAKFVSWPPGREASTEHLTLCILGNDPFGKALDVVRGKGSGSKVWEIRYQRVTDNLQACQILFIAASEAGHLEEVLAGLDGAVLTIGDSEGFAVRGSMINFFMEDRKVRFEINLDAAHRARLNISSQLLRLAKIVREGNGND